MLFGNGHIFKAVREALGKIIHTRALTHSRGNAHQSLVFFGHITEPVTKNLLVLGFGRFGLLASLRHCSSHWRLGLNFIQGMVAHRVILCRGKAFALVGNNMQQHRPVYVFNLV